MSKGPSQKFTDKALRDALASGQSQADCARAFGVTRAAISYRVKLLPVTPDVPQNHSQRIDVELAGGTIIVGSDAHIWPGEPTTAMRALIHFNREIQPEVLCLNGDVFDGARISRHPSIGWESKPTPAAEIAACQEALALLEAPRRIWTLGNHDWRFESYIAKYAPELKGLHGVHLRDFFPDWEPAWRLRVNPGAHEVNIKHRSAGGNALARGRAAGTSIITGHLHSMNATRFTNYRGDHFSVDTGTLARVPGEINVPQFTPYLEDNPVDWAAGFAILTLADGKLLWPEFVHVIDEAAGLVSFRGDVLHV